MMRKIRIAQIGINQYSHGYDIFETLRALPEIFDIAGYAFPALQWACGAGIAYDFNGYLQPNHPAPRYQVAEFLTAFCRGAA